MKEKTLVDELIDRYLSSRATAGETDELRAWLSESEENFRYFLKSRGLYDACHPAFSPERIDKEGAYRRVRSRVYAGRRIVHAARVAVAVVLVALAVGGALLLRSRDVGVRDAPLARAVKPDSSAVTLTLPSGEEFFLADVKTRDIIADSAMVVRGDKASLTYASLEGGMDTAVYHELRVPRAGEFFLELSDGTKVWINAETRVRYPVKFPAGERRIFVDGEAYLEVHKDSTAPFTVVMARNEVTVLGTSFNVSSYSDMPEDRVTLVSGKVCVYSGKNREEVVLFPGEQAMIRREEGTIVKRGVDTEIYCGWKDGRLVFRDNTLEDILRVVERQYDAEVYWHDESLKQYKFSGELKRYERIEHVLKLIGYTDDVKFTVHGKKIIVAKP